MTSFAMIAYVFHWPPSEIYEFDSIELNFWCERASEATR